MNRELLLQIATQALGGRVTVPLDVVRGALAALGDQAALDVEPAPPGLRFHGSAHAVGAPITFSALVLLEGIDVRGPRRLVRVVLRDVELATTPDAPGPLADAIRQEMIDTKNPATLIGNMVALPDFILRAEGDTVVIDLMKIPAIEQDPVVAAAVAAATTYLCVTGIEVADDTLQLRLGLLPAGPREAALSTARALLMPAVRYLWPDREPTR